MKVAWFSPLRPDHSDIANFTDRLRAGLGASFDTRFITESIDGFHEPATGKIYPTKLGQCPHDLLVSLNAGDLPVYNIGNNPSFFAQTWLLKGFKPGIVILHDVKLHHFFEGLYREHLRDEKGYLDRLEEYHGLPGREAGVAYCQSRLSISFMAERFPMTAWAVRNALAVIVHTPYAYEQVKSRTSIPVWMIPLPYQPQANSRVATRSLASAPTSPERCVKLVMFGYLNINRRIIEFLHALATMHERDAFEVHIVGTVFHWEEVNIAVSLLRLTGRVVFHGYVTEERLEEILDEADLAVNLRYPTMGEASGSQLRIWDHALPSLVTRSEGYASLPADTVCFVRPDREQSDIHYHLRRFLERPAAFQTMGQRARQYLLAHHLPDMYVNALSPICEQAAALRSRFNRLWLAERIGQASAPWAKILPPGKRERFYATRIAETI